LPEGNLFEGRASASWSNALSILVTIDEVAIDGTPGMFVMATRWTFKAGSSEEVLEVTRDEVMPFLEARQGYVQSMIVRTSTSSFLSIVVWETEEDGKRAVADLAPLVLRHLGHLVRDLERFSGPVVYDRVSQDLRT
jgi:hypothetical protein